MSYALDYPIVEHAPASERAAFIRRTYAHVAGAILAFAGLEAVLLTLPGVEQIAMRMVSGYNWLIVLGAFMLVSWVADRWAQSATSVSTQYAGLLLYVVAEAVIFLPLIVYANVRAPGAIMSAALCSECSPRPSP